MSTVPSEPTVEQSKPNLPPLTPQQFGQSFPTPTNRFDHVVLPQVEGPTVDRPNRLGVDNRAKDYFVSVLNQKPEDVDKLREDLKKLESYDFRVNFQRCCVMGISVTFFGAILGTLTFAINKRRDKLPPQLRRVDAIQYLSQNVRHHMARAALATCGFFVVSEGAFQSTRKNSWDDMFYHSLMWGAGALGYTLIRPVGASKFFTPMWTSLWAFAGLNYGIICEIQGMDYLAPDFQGKRRFDPLNPLRLAKMERDTGISFDVLSHEANRFREQEKAKLQKIQLNDV